jgi:7,8-dihydropterin-6-yl-methyl-4-(beta-D-ribofuranosyl)aminobenzene 5'-phosphate synthase
MELSRRELLVGAAALPLSGAVAAASFQAPIIDALALTIIIDKETFGPFFPDQDLPGLKVRRAGAGERTGGPRMVPRALAAEFGLSILAETGRGGERRRVLVDFGYTPGALRNNLALLKIDPAALDASVLSHGHLDHYGGAAGLFGDSPRADRLPLYAGGEEAFCERAAMVGDPPPLMGRVDRAELARSGFDVRIASNPAIIADHGLATGTIPLDSFERAAIPTRMRPGKGCAREALSPSKRDAAELPDDGEHELATCFVLRGCGLVVIASCSHRGVINSIRRAQALSGVERVHMVIGGFHLVRPRTEAEARRTAAELATISPAYLVPMHCTGETFITEAERLMPDKVIRPYVGTRFEMA